MDLQNKITTLKGIGKQKAALFEKLGLVTLNDLVLYAPRGYTDYTQITKLNEAPIDFTTNFERNMHDSRQRKMRGRKSIKYACRWYVYKYFGLFIP